jgi:hypothetical protein
VLGGYVVLDSSGGMVIIVEGQALPLNCLAAENWSCGGKWGGTIRVRPIRIARTHDNGTIIISPKIIAISSCSMRMALADHLLG